MARHSRTNYILAYYQGICDGTEVVGKWVRLLYEHIVHGLQDKQYIFDQKKADAAIKWMETHGRHVEGKLAPNNIQFELWQKAFLSLVYGILDPKTGKRQFREIVLIVARKNGKSIVSSQMALNSFFNDGFGTRVYCLAPKLDQADIIYGDMWAQILLDDELCFDKKDPEASNRAKHRMTDLYIASTNSTAKKIAFSAKKSDGFNPSFVVCDEVASWSGDKGLKQYEVMKSGMGARDEPILLSASTSGYENESIFDELFKRGTRFLLGDSQESRLLPVFYTIDDVEKWNDINELRKSNPNLGVSVSVDYLLEEIRIAEGSLSKKAEFITKYCNLKQNSSQAWLSTQTINKCCCEAITADLLRDSYCVGGLDLSQTTDLTSACIVVEKQKKLYVLSHFWLPSEKIEEAIARDGLPYWQYVQKGWLSLSGENFVDYHDCYKWFTDMVEQYKIFPLKIGYDRYSAQYLVQDMQQYGFHMDDVYQGENLTPVIRETEGLMKDGSILIGDNDLLKVHCLDSALKTNAETQRVRLIKMRQMAHIDGMAALLDAMTVRQKWYGEIGDQLMNKG